MATRHIITRGIGPAPATLRFIVTHGLAIAALAVEGPTFAVALEERTFAVPREAQTFAVAAETRTWTVPKAG